MSYDDYFTRPQDCDEFDRNLYIARICPEKNDPKDVLFSDCFSHHVNYTDPHVDSLVYCPDAKNRYIALDNLSAYFVNKQYAIPSIFNFMDGGPEIDFDEFVSMFVDSPNHEIKPGEFNKGSNRIRFVVGDVGEGKSSFIKKIKVTIAKNKDKYDKDFRLLLLYMDIEELYNSQGDMPTPLNPIFLSDLFREIQSEIMSQLPDIDISDTTNYSANYHPEVAMKSLLGFLHTNKIRPILFVDNLDCYHFYGARYSYFEQYDHDQEDSIDKNIMWLIKTLTYQSRLGEMGMNVMIAARSYVYENILAIRQAGLNTNTDTMEAVTLHTCKEEAVVDTRIGLLSEAINTVAQGVPSSAREMKQQLLPLWYDAMRKSFSVNKNTAFGIISECGQHGLRSLVAFLSSLNIPYANTELLERFFERQASTLFILYFNNMKKKYSQKNGHFPNMFLNDCTVMNGPSFPDAHKPHMHSYWIKYFILKLLVAKGRLKFGKIYDTFCKEGGYEDHMVRHVVGSLCTANEFRCAELELGQAETRLEGRWLIPTERGKMLCGTRPNGYKNELCFSFQYLSTIIDDRWLAFPNPRFDSIYDAKLNYSSLYETDPRKYSEYSVDLTIRKARNVLPFIRCLAACYEVEIEGRKPELHTFLSKNDLVPDLDKISLDVIESANSIRKSVSGKKSPESLENLTELYNTLRADHEKIKGFFQEYYETGTEVSA